MPYSISKAGRALLVMLLAMVFIVLGTGEGRTDECLPKWWQEKVLKLKAEGKDVKVMKSKSMEPEKSPEEFLKRYKKVREQAGDNFTFQMFVEDVARGLAIEQRYNKCRGIFYIKKENLNPNYYWAVWEEDGPIPPHLFFNCNKFCITPELLREIFGKENGKEKLQGETYELYHYRFLGLILRVEFISSINKKCASDTSYYTEFFHRIENRGPLKGKEEAEY